MKKYIFSSLLLLLLLQGCSKFEDINTNPNSPVAVRSDLLLNNIMYSAFGEDADVANQTGMYSTFVGGDMGGCWGQHLGKIQYNDEERYRPRTSVVQAFWNTIYEDVCNDADVMYKLGEKEANKTVQGVALVLKAYGFHVLTDCYGNIPFSEALKAGEGIFNPKYDEQEDVYVGILAMLDEANTLLASGEGSIPSSSDRMYGGDATKWRKFANSLKFRCLMRTSNKTTPKINLAAQLQEIASSRPIFTSNSDDAKFPFGTAQPAANPFYETVVYGSRVEWKVGAALVDRLLALQDSSRLAVFAGTNASGQYVGKPAGYSNLPIEGVFDDATMSPIGTFYLQPSSDAFFMSNAEMQFLLAEARQRGLISTSSAETYYDNGILASYLANGLSVSDYNAFRDKGTVDFAPATALTQIATQKWLCLFGQGIEAWTEWRRTQIPELTPAVEGFLDEIPSRYQYPLSEQSINVTNYNAAVSAQGPDLLTTKIWWLKP